MPVLPTGGFWSQGHNWDFCLQLAKPMEANSNSLWKWSTAFSTAHFRRVDMARHLCSEPLSWHLRLCFHLPGGVFCIVFYYNYHLVFIRVTLQKEDLTFWQHNVIRVKPQYLSNRMRGAQKNKFLQNNPIVRNWSFKNTVLRVPVFLS